MQDVAHKRVNPVQERLVVCFDVVTLCKFKVLKRDHREIDVFWTGCPLVFLPGRWKINTEVLCTLCRRRLGVLKIFCSISSWMTLTTLMTLMMMMMTTTTMTGEFVSNREENVKNPFPPITI
jgi:hypothetical protein